MRNGRRWRRAGHRAVSPIIGTILLLAITIVAGTILWSFHIYTPAAPPQITFLIRSGGSDPVWGDGTDCEKGTGSTGPGCGSNPVYSFMNTTQIIIASHSPADISLSDIIVTFVCNNGSSGGPTTVLLTGTLANMTWIPGQTGSSGSAPAGSPLLGYCATLKIGGYGGSDDTAYNRLCLFIPINSTQTSLLENGDTFLLYIHAGGFPLDYSGDCSTGSNTPCLDGDDYHGAPPWCFTTEGACTLDLSYVGNPSELLASIPVYSLAPPSSG
jgi:flagellin-like protein